MTYACFSVKLRPTRHHEDSPRGESAPMRGKRGMSPASVSRDQGLTSGLKMCCEPRNPWRRTQCQPTLVGEIPGQERLDVLGRLSTRHSTAFQVPRQPPSRIEFPVGQRRQERKHRRRQTPAPQGTRTVEVLPCHGRAASRSFRSVVVHRNSADHPQTAPVPSSALEALQNLAAWLAEFGIGKFFHRLGTHRLHRPTQQASCSWNLAEPRG